MRPLLLLLWLSPLRGFTDTNFRVRHEADGLVSVDETGFDELHKHNRGMVVLFTDRYDCPECNGVRVLLARIHRDYGERFPADPNFVLVDCSQHPRVCRRKLIGRLLPAVDFVIHKHVHHYRGDFSEESLRRAVHRHFAKDRLRPFQLAAYLERLSHSKKTNATLAVFAHAPAGSHGLHMLGLARLEHRDAFFYCDAAHPCPELFAAHPDSDALFVQGARTEFHRLTSHRLFNDLYYLYRDFKSPFYVPFGEEFRQKVLVEKRPTLVYVLVDAGPKSSQDAARFLKEARRHFSKFHYCLVHISELGPAELALFDEFLEEVGLVGYGFPAMFILDKDPRRNALRKFFLTRDHFEHDTVHHSIEAWHYGQLNPWPKSENQFEATRGHLRVVSNHNFKTALKQGVGDKAVLLHRDLARDPLSKTWFDHVDRLAAAGLQKGVEFLAMDADRNDLVFEAARLPCVQIFLKGQWDQPILFDVPPERLGEFERVLARRHLWRKVERPQPRREEGRAGEGDGEEEAAGDL